MRSSFLGSYEEKMYDPLDKLVKRQALFIHEIEGVIRAVNSLQNQGRYEEAKALTNGFIDGLNNKD